jgi:hypothetical protein
MTRAPESDTARRRPSRLFAFALSYVVSRALLTAAGFRYNPLSDPLSGRKLAISFGTWAAVSLLVTWGLRRWTAARAVGRAALPSRAA